MPDKIKKIAKHSSIYMIGNILNRMVAFIMLPFYTNYLNPAEYGTIEILSLTIDFLMTLTSLGMIETISKFYSKYKTDESKNIVISSAFIGMIILTIVAVICCFLFIDQITVLLFNTTNEYITYTRITFITLLFTGSIGIPYIYLRVKYKSLEFIIINCVKLILNLTLNIFFLVFMNLGVIGVLYSMLITNFIICIYLLSTLIYDVGIKFHFDIYKKMFKFSMPLIISSLSMWVITYVDRYFLVRLSNLNEVGIYSLAYKLGALVTILGVGPFLSVWGIMRFEISDKKNTKDTNIKALNYFLLFVLTLSLSISILSSDILRLMSSKSYWIAYRTVPLITFSYVCFGLTYLTNTGILIKNKTKYNAISTFTALLLNIVFNYVLISRYGAIGAGISTLIAFFARLVLDTYFSQRLYFIKYEWKKIILIIIVNIILTIAGVYFKIENIVISISVHLLIISIFPISLYFLNILSADEKKNIIFIIYSIRKKLSFNT